MSTNKNTITMVADVQQRIPIGLDQGYVMGKLIDAWEWVEQQGAFTWNETYADVTVRAGTFWVDPADMPSRFDAGKPVTIYGQTFSSVYGSQGSPFAYVAPDQIGLHQLYHVAVAPSVFSCFTIVSNLGVTSAGPSPAAQPRQVPYILFAPSAAVTDFDSAYHMSYHQIPNFGSVVYGNVFFPTPDAFDQLFVDLAEGNIKRIYGFAKWGDIIQKAQNGALLLLDKYRSTKREPAGLTEQAKETQETQLKQQA